MNKGKWRALSKTRAPYDIFLAKLMEEVGEVGNAYIEQNPSDVSKELDHVIFIAQCFKDRING